MSFFDRSMRTYVTLLTSTACDASAGSSAALPLQPTHIPLRFFSAAFTATAIPPANGVPGESGTATRFETMMRRAPMRPPNSTTNASQFYDAGQGVGMRQIAPKLAGVPMNVLGEESEGSDARQPAGGSIRRMICGGRNARSNRSKRGAKSVTRSLSQSAPAGPSQQSP